MINYLITIVGPTAICKTSLSIEIAKHFNTEIVSSDSRQFYKEMHIGTAVPSLEELNQVKHHFIQNLSIHDEKAEEEKKRVAQIKENVKNSSSVKELEQLGFKLKKIVVK